VNHADLYDLLKTIDPRVKRMTRCVECDAVIYEPFERCERCDEQKGGSKS
jgi:hypothetical protein